MTFDTFFDGVLEFTFYYPLFMAYLWMAGAVFYFFYRERPEHHPVDRPPELPEYPPVTYLVPCHNEGANVVETVRSLLDQDWPAIEVIAINDASRDDTGALLDRLAQEDARLRVIHFDENQGKAMGLRVGTIAARHEYLICIDGDALLDRHATRWIMRHFLNTPRVAAVTGNPRVRNRSSLLGRIQVGEFSSIIGVIKRAHRIYGRVFTISGVVAAFRKSALHRVGYWGLDMVTEDIDISWRLQINHWDIRYEPNALCWILMPETLAGLWRQRCRWAQGGIEVLREHARELLRWRARRMWIVVVELVISTGWAYAMGMVFLLWTIGQVSPLPLPLSNATIPPGWSGVLLGTTCLLQFAVSMAVDSRYERGLARVYYWIIWYPMAYWMVQMAATIVAVPRALMKPKGRRAVWISPDRGLRPAREGADA